MSKYNPTYQSQQFLGKVVLDPTTNKKRVQMLAPINYQAFLEIHTKVGDEVTMNISSKRPKRSLAQNNYFHLYLSLIGLSSGHTVEELKAWVKGKFLSKGITEVFGSKTRVVKDTSALNILEFIELLERIEDTTGIPLPNTEPFLKPLTYVQYDKLKGRQREIYSRLVINKKIGLKKP